MNNTLLTPRLLKVCELVGKCKSCADVGCDHARVAIWLCENERVERVIATDVHRGPIERARAAVKNAGLEQKITCILTDGLEGAGKTDAVIIAGMGGDLIADILSRAPWSLEEGTRLVLQPMTAAWRLRKFLFENRCAIDAEEYAKEGRRLYAVLRTGGEFSADSCPDESYFYISRAAQDSPLVGEYAAATVKKLKSELAGLERAIKPDTAAIEHRKTAIELLARRFDIK